MRRALEREVWNRAGGCCEYCRMPQEYDETPFELEHIIAELHGGPTIPSNLCLAYFACNRRKGPNLGGIDPRTGQRVWLFNPRRHGWRIGHGGEGGTLLELWCGPRRRKCGPCWSGSTGWGWLPEPGRPHCHRGASGGRTGWTAAQGPRRAGRRGPRQILISSRPRI